MEEYETEDQQIDAIKRWWNENGTSLLVGLGLGVAALTGWNYYTGEVHKHSIEASDMYVSVMKQVESNNIDDAGVATSNKLIADYADTPYASLVSLALAKHEFEKGNADDAVSHLKWVVAHGVEVETQNIARLRLVRILLDQKKYDEAETWLLSDYPAAFEARYQELRGDLFVALGDIEQARVAYDKAIKQDVDAGQLLRLKRQDLGTPDYDLIPDVSGSDSSEQDPSESKSPEQGELEQKEKEKVSTEPPA